MATVAISGGRDIAVRSMTDRRALRDYLERDRLYAAYAICDLEDGEFGKTRWGGAFERDQVVAIVLEYAGTSPQPLFVMGDPDGIRAVLRDLIRPRAAYVASHMENIPAVEAHYRLEPGPQMVRMWVDRQHFNPYPADASRLLPSEIGDLNRLYQLGFSSWLPPAAVADGVYYGVRTGRRLVSAAGTHVISRQAGIAVVGNVYTDVDFRGRGLATAVTGAVTAELLRSCEHVVLNVRADNPPALQAYRRLGYREHVRFEERLGHRLGSPLPDLAASMRRLFSFRRETPSR